MRTITKNDITSLYVNHQLVAVISLPKSKAKALVNSGYVLDFSK